MDDTIFNQNQKNSSLLFILSLTVLSTLFFFQVSIGENDSLVDVFLFVLVGFIILFKTCNQIMAWSG